MHQHYSLQTNVSSQAVAYQTASAKTLHYSAIAGAGQGIGRAFAHALGEAGASVAIVDINFKKAQAVTEELRSKGIRSIAVGTDVTKKADCKK